MTQPGEGQNIDTTIPDDAAAGVVSEQEAQTFPDSTEGNRGPGAANNSGFGDERAVITTPAPDVEMETPQQGGIGNSTNNLTEHAFNTLTPSQEVNIRVQQPIRNTFDVVPAFTEALGTTNIQPGPANSAIRSNVYKYPDGRGQRAALLYKDGTLRLMANGTPYADWYGAGQDEGVACLAIIYFDQRRNSDNPFVSVRWYKKAELPQPAEVVDPSF